MEDITIEVPAKVLSEFTKACEKFRFSLRSNNEINASAPITASVAATVDIWNSALSFVTRSKGKVVTETRAYLDHISDAETIVYLTNVLIRAQALSTSLNSTLQKSQKKEHNELFEEVEGQFSSMVGAAQENMSGNDRLGRTTYSLYDQGSTAPLVELEVSELLAQSVLKYMARTSLCEEVEIRVGGAESTTLFAEPAEACQRFMEALGGAKTLDRTYKWLDSCKTNEFMLEAARGSILSSFSAIFS